jgi:hypothetical protein
LFLFYVPLYVQRRGCTLYGGLVAPFTAVAKRLTGVHSGGQNRHDLRRVCERVTVEPRPAAVSASADKRLIDDIHAERFGRAQAKLNRTLTLEVSATPTRLVAAEHQRAHRRRPLECAVVI